MGLLGNLSFSVLIYIHMLRAVAADAYAKRDVPDVIQLEHRAEATSTSCMIFAAEEHP